MQKTEKNDTILRKIRLLLWQIWTKLIGLNILNKSSVHQKNTVFISFYLFLFHVNMFVVFEPQHFKVLFKFYH